MGDIHSPFLTSVSKISVIDKNISLMIYDFIQSKKISNVDKTLFFIYYFSFLLFETFRLCLFETILSVFSSMLLKIIKNKVIIYVFS